jgi:hypothetical protein
MDEYGGLIEVAPDLDPARIQALAYFVRPSELVGLNRVQALIGPAIPSLSGGTLNFFLRIAVAYHRDFIAAANKAWERVANGIDGGEMLFAAYKAGGGFLHFQWAPYSPVAHNSYAFGAGYFAIIHTHPNKLDGHPTMLPSAKSKDAEYAAAARVPYYTLTDRGAYLTMPNGFTMMIRPGTEWLR